MFKTALQQCSNIVSGPYSEDTVQLTDGEWSQPMVQFQFLDQP